MDDHSGARIARAHVAELARFFAAHDRWLFGHACVRTHADRELAADLVQDTFEAAATAWPALRALATGQQRAWLLSTLAHKDISDHRRREAFRRRHPDIEARYTPAAPDTAAQALNEIALACAREIIACMPPRQQEIALVRWQHHMRAAEIAALAARIEAGRQALRALAADGDALASDIRSSLEQINDAGRAKIELLEANLRLVISIARRFSGRGVLFSDLVEEGNIGLIRAADKFDRTKGYRFSTYATW